MLEDLVLTLYTMRHSEILGTAHEGKHSASLRTTSDQVIRESI